MVFSNFLLHEFYSIKIPKGIHCCNVVIGSVFLWEPQVTRLQLQLFSRCCLGIRYCSVDTCLAGFFDIVSIICSNFVGSGSLRIRDHHMEEARNFTRDRLPQGKTTHPPKKTHINKNILHKQFVQTLLPVFCLFWSVQIVPILLAQFVFVVSADRKRGQRRGATSKKCQRATKYFRHFLTFLTLGKKSSKVSIT